MIKSSFRPPFYRETFPQQNERLGQELDKAREAHTLQVVRTVSRWFDSRRMVGVEYSAPECFIEAKVQCQLEGVVTDHLGAAASLIRDIYTERGRR